MPSIPSRALIAGVCALAITALAAPAASAARDLYVALGDSYARGSQPGQASGEEGFVYQLPGLARGRGYDLEVVNFGCGAATSASLVGQVGCENRKVAAPGERPYPDVTQLAAASEFIAANRDRVALVTVVVGLNDLKPCVRERDIPACVARQSRATGANVAMAAKVLREAAGPSTPIVGTGYPNVYLGAWVRPGGGAGHRRAREMAGAFRWSLNPALRAAYAEGQAAFADATRASGGYGSLAGRREPTAFGRLPAPVADVCRISWYCSKVDIHLNKAGYGIIARMVTAKLPRR